MSTLESPICRRCRQNEGTPGHTSTCPLRGPFPLIRLPHKISNLQPGQLCGELGSNNQGPFRSTRAGATAITVPSPRDPSILFQVLSDDIPSSASTAPTFNNAPVSVEGRKLCYSTKSLTTYSRTRHSTTLDQRRLCGKPRRHLLSSGFTVACLARPPCREPFYGSHEIPIDNLILYMCLSGPAYLFSTTRRFSTFGPRPFGKSHHVVRRDPLALCYALHPPRPSS